MRTSDNPWIGLRPGAIDARRLDSGSKHDFFWIVSDQSEPGLLLRLSPETQDEPPLPRLRHLSLTYRSIGEARVLTFILKDLEQRELFAALCLDIASAAEGALDNQNALHRALRRTLRWHHLLRGGRTDILTLEEQRGLIGELAFLRRLVDLIGTRAAIEAWRGPFGAAKDFELSNCLVEVKARRGAARPFVSISSEDQLSDVDGARLFLLVMQVDAAVIPAGGTLTDHVKELDDLFASSSLDSYQLWEEALSSSGFDFADDYSERRWSTGTPVHFEVSAGFPRIAAPVVPGVSAVRYSLSLDACAPHAVEAGLVDDVVVEGIAG